MNVIQVKKRTKNPYYYLSIFVGSLFFPFKYIRKVKEDYMPLLKIINSLFVNNITASFLALWYPFIFIGILPNVGSQQLMVFNIGSLIPTIIGVQVMPIIVVTLKNSSILKRIGATETKVSDLMAVLIFYFAIVSIFSSLMNIGLGMAIYNKKIDFSQVHFGEMIFGLIIGTIVGISFGMFLSGILKTPNAALVIGVTIVVPGSFLTGQFLPPNMTNNWAGGYLNIISFVFPQKITAEFIQIAANESGKIASTLPSTIDGWDGFKLIQHTKSSIFDLNSVSCVLSAETGIYSNLFSEAVKNPIGNAAILENLLEKMKDAQFELSTNITKILAWSLSPVYVGAYVYATTRTFSWGVR